MISYHLIIGITEIFSWKEFHKKLKLKQKTIFEEQNSWYSNFYRYFVQITNHVFNIVIILNIISDVFENKLIINIRDLIFNSLLFPFAITTFLYWFHIVITYGASVHNNFKIYKAEHFFHIFPSVYSFIQMYFVKHERIITIEIIIMFSVLKLYILYLGYLGFIKKDWPYSYLVGTTLFFKFLLLVLINLICLVTYSFGLYLGNTG